MLDLKTRCPALLLTAALVAPTPALAGTGFTGGYEVPADAGASRTAPQPDLAPLTHEDRLAQYRLDLATAQKRRRRAAGAAGVGCFISLIGAAFYVMGGKQDEMYKTLGMADMIGGGVMVLVGLGAYASIKLPTAPTRTSARLVPTRRGVALVGRF